MNRFHLFICDNYYPSGFDDYHDSYTYWSIAYAVGENAIARGGKFYEIVWTDDEGNLTTNIPKDVKNA